MKRRNLSKRRRLFVLNRDGYTCQYCGATDVTLEIDHKVPVSLGGTNHTSNLATACFACNRSKGARELDAEALMDSRAPSLEFLAAMSEMDQLTEQWRFSNFHTHAMRFV